MKKPEVKLTPSSVKPTPTDTCVLTFAQLRNIQFNELLNKLLDMPMSFDLARDLYAIIEQVGQAQFETDHEWNQLRDLYLKDNVLKSDLSDDQKFKGAGEINNFMIKQIILHTKPLPKAVIETLGLSARELILLRGVVI